MPAGRGFLGWRLQVARDLYLKRLERRVEPLRLRHMAVQPDLSRERGRQAASARRTAARARPRRRARS